MNAIIISKFISLYFQTCMNLIFCSSDSCLDFFDIHNYVGASNKATQTKLLVSRPIEFPKIHKADG